MPEHYIALHCPLVERRLQQWPGMTDAGECSRSRSLVHAFKQHIKLLRINVANGCMATSVNELTLGILSFVQTPSDSSLSRISHAKIDGHSLLYWAILPTTSGVATRGLLPPIALGLMEPVS